MENIRKWSDLQYLDTVKSVLYELKIASSHSTCRRWEVPTPAQLHAADTQKPQPGHLLVPVPAPWGFSAWPMPQSSAVWGELSPTQRCPSRPDTRAAPAPPPFPTIPTFWDPLGLLHPLTFGVFELFLLPRAHPELIPPRMSARCLKMETFPRPAPPAVPPQLSDSRSPDAGCHLLEESKRFRTANLC